MEIRPSIDQMRSNCNKARISVQEIRLSRSLFIVVFAFMLCWGTVVGDCNLKAIFHHAYAKKCRTTMHVFPLHFQCHQPRHIRWNESKLQK